MKKTLALLATLALLVSSVAVVQAATLKCRVTKVEDKVVTMDCGEDAAKLSAGTEVKVKTAKAKAAAIEGC